MTDLKDFTDVKIVRVDTLDEAEDFLRWLGERREVLAWDLETGETNGQALKWWLPSFKIRLAQFGDMQKAWVFRPDRFGAVIEKVFTDYDRDTVTHNGVGFDGHALRSLSFTLPKQSNWHDTLLQSRILDSRGKHNLKFLANREFGEIASIGESALNKAFRELGFGKDKGMGFSHIPYGTVAYDAYSAIDVILTARLHGLYYPQIKANYLEAYERELAAWHVTFEHEHKGMSVDLKFAHEIENEYEAKLGQLKLELNSLGISKPGSKAQRLEVLYKEGFEPDDWTDTGEPKLDKKILEKFASPTAQLLLEYGRVEHWLTAYVRKTINESYNEVVYPNINAFGAKTGRQSASNPPVQQLPSHHPDAWKMRAMFLPRPGDKLWSIDYDGEENRLAAHFSKDKALTNLIMSGADIHRYTAAIVHGIPEDQIEKEQRSIVKNVVYADQYGAGVKKLMKMLDMSRDEVTRIKDGIAKAYPELTRWKKDIELEAKQRYHSTGSAYAYTWGGRKVFADQFEDKEPSYYTLTNYVLQGSGADVLKEALNRIAAAGLSNYMYLPVHDELLFSLPDDESSKELALQLSRIMTFDNGEFDVPLTCSPEGPFDRWQGH
jgi:DNA polymerase-1